MVLHSTRWLALSYFTYFFSYGIFLPFWSVWLKGTGLTPETIGLLLGSGLVARFLGSLLIAPRVSDPSRLIMALRVLALLTLVFALAFWFGTQVAWLMVVMVGFNLFFSPLVPLTDALANTWQKQITMDYGRVRLWGSIAFVIGSALTGKLVSLYDSQAILALLTVGVASMLIGMLLRPSVMPQGEKRQQEAAGWGAWRTLLVQHWRFLACVSFLQGAHAAYYGFSAIYWQGAGYTASAVGYLWSLGVVAEVVTFALSKKVFRRFSARDLLLLSAVCGLLRWGILGWSTAESSSKSYRGANSALWHVHRLPPGGDALHFRAAGQRGYPLTGDVFGGGNGRQHCRHDRFCRFPLSASSAGRFLGDGATGAPGDAAAPPRGGAALRFQHLLNMFALIHAERLLGVN